MDSQMDIEEPFQNLSILSEDENSTSLSQIPLTLKFKEPQLKAQKFVESFNQPSLLSLIVCHGNIELINKVKSMTFQDAIKFNLSSHLAAQSHPNQINQKHIKHQNKHCPQSSKNISKIAIGKQKKLCDRKQLEYFKKVFPKIHFLTLKQIENADLIILNALSSFSAKVAYAILTGKKILSFEYISECLSQNKIVTYQESNNKLFHNFKMPSQHLKNMKVHKLHNIHYNAIIEELGGKIIPNDEPSNLKIVQKNISDDSNQITVKELISLFFKDFQEDLENRK